MKNILILFLAFSINISCKAQQIIDIYGPEDYGNLNGAYYKDIHGFRDQYVGTWLYTNGANSLKLVFQKRDHLLSSGRFTFYEDMLVGEYQYIENGVEKVNTLTQINTNYGNQAKDMDKHNITDVSCIWSPDRRPKCTECVPNEKRLRMSLTEPNYDGLGIASNSFVLRRFMDNGVEKLKVWFYDTNQIVFTNPDGSYTRPAPLKLPFGEYVLIKQ